MKPRFHPGWVLLIGVLAMSTAAVFIRFAQAEAVSPTVIAAYRLGIATLLLSIPAIRQHIWRDYATLETKQIRLIILSGILLGIHFTAWITSLRYTSVMSSVVLVTTTPLWMALATPFVLKEKVRGFVWAGIILAMLGGIVIGIFGQASGAAGTTWGDLLALTGAITGAGYLLIGRYVRKHLSLLAYLWIVYGIAALFVTIWAIASGGAFVGHKPIVYLWLIALGIIPQLIGHSAANYAVRYAPATLVGVSTLGEPIGSTILAIIFLHELPATGQLWGGLLILTGILIVSLIEAQAKPEEKIA